MERRSRAARREHADEQLVSEYVQIQGPGGVEVSHAERIATKSLGSRRYEIWDVHTVSDGRWWVIDSPMNLYPQADFPSMDKAFTFHLGLMERMMAEPANRARATVEEQDTLAVAWRRWRGAASALDDANEAEDFQAVGVMCIDALLALVNKVSHPDMVPPGSTAPKGGDFVHWSELIADAIASGSSAERVRGYLKATSKVTWELVSWLKHSTSASRVDAMLALDATQHVLGAFGMATVRLLRGSPDRCPECGSYRLVGWPTEDPEGYVTLCQGCGWQDNERAIVLKE